MKNIYLKIASLLLIIVALFAGCSSNPQSQGSQNNQTLYTCPDGSKISDLSFCPTTSTTSTTTTTTTTLYPKPKPEHICRINSTNNACIDDNGTHYPVGTCADDVKTITYYACDSMGWWCEQKTFDDFDCTTIQKICIQTPSDDKLLLNSSLNIVRCINPKDTNETGGQNITVTGK